MSINQHRYRYGDFEYIDIDKMTLENIDIAIKIDKEIKENIDIDMKKLKKAILIR